MKPIFCKRPAILEPKAIGTSFVFNFLGRRCGLAVITNEGTVFHAYETEEGLTLQTAEGATMDKGPVFRFIERHLALLRAGSTPALLSSVDARKRPEKGTKIKCAVKRVDNC